MERDRCERSAAPRAQWCRCAMLSTPRQAALRAARPLLRPSHVRPTYRRLGVDGRLRVVRTVWIALSGCLLLSACGSGGTHASSTARPGAPSGSPAAGGGPCASVRTTTPIAKVPPACAALWEPYGVTMVPPPDELQQEHVPAAPPVRNMTNGAVSDADAQHWADANNWDSGWYSWAEAHDQPRLLSRVVGPSLINPSEEAALSAGATIAQPECNLYPTSNTLFAVGADGKAYFTRKGLPADDGYVLTLVFPSCTPAVATFPDGHQEKMPQPLTGTFTAFAPGGLRHDQLLGDLWYSDAGGNCSDPAGPPPEWCGR